MHKKPSQSFFWHSKKLILLGLSLIFVLGVLSNKHIISKLLNPRTLEPTHIDGLLWPTNPLESFSLLGSDGQRFDLDRLRGRWSFLFFGYTSCPDICPTTLSTLKKTIQQLSKETPTDLPQVVLVSVDPNRDTIEKITSYVEYFDPSFLGVTAESIEEINHLSSQLYIPHNRLEPDEHGNYEVMHSASILLIDPQVRRVGIFSTPHQANTIIKRYQSIKKFVETQS